MKKLYIFDLDDTIYLRKVNKTSQYDYHKLIRKVLTSLKKEGKVLCMASHNLDPISYLEELGVYHLFDYIIGEYPRKKDSMVLEILERTGYEKQDVIFFDDMDWNTEPVSKMGIDCYLIKSRLGILEKLID
jgi:HAD superfamily phosphatase (TIGR01681 family)